jgi:predicted dehydrogenase
MKQYAILMLAPFIMSTACSTKQPTQAGFTGAKGEVKLVTLDPGHFHAALVQKTSYPQVSNKVHVYAPAGEDVNEHLKKIDGYNNRADSPTSWEEVVYTGADFMQRMLADNKGNVMVTAGNNGKKTDYIKQTLAGGVNVLADKPMAIDEAGFEKLKECFNIAREKGVMLYDIMTERHEITTMLQKEFSLIPAVYGTQLAGTPEEPGVVKESVHHFFKVVSGNPLKRPAWFFDVEQEGDGIVDVTTHLVDLVQWECFPGQIIDYKKDIEMIDANRWSTTLNPTQFKEVTGFENYPTYLAKDIKDSLLNVYCNGDITYKIKGIHAKVSVIWNYTFPKGGGDTHFSVMRGSKSNLFIRQGEAQGYKPVLFIEAVEGTDLAAYEKALQASMTAINAKYPGIALHKVNANTWRAEAPAKYHIGHEAHFGQVTENFLQYLQDGALPDWEEPNMIAKYYVTTKALSMAKAKQAK